ncbi:MAG: hypothetical protein EA374_01645 [Acholeplasmatales bacterium]|nr:MAG: hypothetical protein EA374_01645 [Acholeplasmatales bacterium]
MHSAYRSTLEPHPVIIKEQEAIELEYLRKKLYIVNGIMLIMAAPLFWLLHHLQVPGQSISVFGLIFGLYFIINLAFFAYEDYFNSLKLSIYTSALTIYALAIALIIEIQTPSMFTVLFLAYAIVSIYQDRKIALLNSLLLLSVGSLFVTFYPETFRGSGDYLAQQIYLYTFLVIFVSLLSTASSILIKRKMYFYRQLAVVKETELRMINLIFDLKKQAQSAASHQEDYYEKVHEFTVELSEKINMDNIFIEKIDIIRKLHEGRSKQEILAHHPNHTEESLIELERLVLNEDSRLKNLAYKISQAADVHISRKELYAESHVKTLKKTFDSNYTKIIAFSSLYTLLRIDNPIHKGLDPENIKRCLTETDFYHMMDAKIIDIYRKNTDVLEKIHDDAFKRKVSS